MIPAPPLQILEIEVDFKYVDVNRSQGVLVKVQQRVTGMFVPIKPTHVHVYQH